MENTKKKFPENISINIPITIGVDCNNRAKPGQARWKMEGCIATVTNDNGTEIGTIGGAFGADYTVSVNVGGYNASLIILKQDVWKAVMEQLGLDGDGNPINLT